MQKFIVISLCTFAFFVSHDVKSEDVDANRSERVIEAPHCKDSIKINGLKFTRPGVIEKMKPFVIREKNIKKTLIQDDPA